MGEFQKELSPQMKETSMAPLLNLMGIDFRVPFLAMTGAFNLSTWEAEEGASLNLRPA